MTTPGHHVRDVRTAWERELDLLERELAAAERLGARGTPVEESPEAPQRQSWTAPVLPGALPAELLPRAVDLHRRQCLVRDRLQQARTATSRHRTYVDQMTAAQTGIPRYVDLRA